MLTKPVSISSRLLFSICQSLAILLFDISLCCLLTKAELKIFFALNTQQLLTRNSLLYKFWKDFFLPTCAPSSIFKFEFLNKDDTVVKLRKRALQPTSLANLMTLQNVYKKSFMIYLRLESLQLPLNVISTHKV